MNESQGTPQNSNIWVSIDNKSISDEIKHNQVASQGKESLHKKVNIADQVNFELSFDYEEFEATECPIANINVKTSNGCDNENILVNITKTSSSKIRNDKEKENFTMKNEVREIPDLEFPQNNLKGKKNKGFSQNDCSKHCEQNQSSSGYSIKGFRNSQPDCKKEILSQINAHSDEQFSQKQSQSSLKFTPTFLSKSSKDNKLKNQVLPILPSTSSSTKYEKDKKKSQCPVLSMKNKSAFKPPSCKKKSDSTKQQAKFDSSPNKEASSDLLYFSKLDQDAQHEIIIKIQKASSLSLSLCLSNGKALVNAFDFEQENIMNFVIFSECVISQPICLSISNDFISSTRKILLNCLSNGDCQKTIINCKEFLYYVHRVLEVENSQSICCKNMDDPVISCWLLQPDNPPSTFEDMAKLARLPIENFTTWQSCIKRSEILCARLLEELKNKHIDRLYSLVEMRLVPLLACMETRRIKVDTELLTSVSYTLKVSNLYIIIH